MPRSRLLIGVLLPTLLIIGAGLLWNAQQPATPAPGPPNRAFPSYPRFNPLPPAQQQVVDGVNVTIQPLYADPQLVVISYTVAGPPRPYNYYLSLTPDLSSPAAHEQQLLLGDGREIPVAAEDFELYRPQAVAPPQVGQSGLLVFDSSSLADLPNPLPLRLTVPLQFNNNPYLPPLPVSTGGPVPTAIPALPPPPSLNTTLTFQFALPLDPRQRWARPKQQVAIGDTTFVLDGVRVTATETRLLLIPTAKSPQDYIDWTISGLLQVGSSTAAKGYPVWGLCSYGPHCELLVPGRSLIDAPVDGWTLTINEVARADAYSNAGILNTQPPGGSWPFHFSVPAVANPRPPPASTSTP